MKQKKRYKVEQTELFTAPETIKVVALAWLVPGLGHWLQGRKRNAAILFGCILASMILGVVQGGDLFPFQGEGMFRTIGAFSQFGAGALYGLFRLIADRGNPLDITYDYGTIYFLIAGMLNWLAVIDTFDIAVKRK